MSQMAELAETDFKATIINIFKDLKEKMVIISEKMRNLERQV